MNLGQLLEGQEAVTAFNKGIQLMIALRENEALQVHVCLSYQSQISPQSATLEHASTMVKY